MNELKTVHVCEFAMPAIQAAAPQVRDALSPRTRLPVAALKLLQVIKLFKETDFIIETL